MSGIHHDDEWKLEGVKVDSKDPVPTRSQLQERVDFDYGTAKIDHDEWSRRTDELSKVKEEATDVSTH